MDANSSSSERICPTCGTAVTTTASFCTTCGGALPDDSPPAPHVSPAPTPSSPSAPIGAAESAQIAAPSGRSRRIAMAVAVASVAGILALVWFASSDDSQQTRELVATEDTSIESSTSVATSPPSTSEASTAPTAPTATTPRTTNEPPIDTPAPTPIDPWEPDYFSTPDEAIADWLSELAVPFAGTCDSLAGQESELGGSVLCSQLVEDLVPAQVHIWGVFATDDFGGWILVDVGSAGWSVADESFELERPDW